MVLITHFAPSAHMQKLTFGGGRLCRKCGRFGCTLLVAARMGWVPWLCRVDWVLSGTATSRDEKPQPESGAGAFRCQDGDTTKHLRYEPSRLQLLRDRLA
jgi:hypothetical protein